ncbi:transposase-like protein [Arthrobacter sp. UYCu512]
MMSVQVEAAAEVVAVEGGERVSVAEKSPVVNRALIARLVGDAQAQGLSIDGEGGLLAQLTKLVVESALEGEITAHLGYEKHERAEEPAGNSRNGTRSKTVLTKAGPVSIEVPRDRAGTFEPAVVAKRQRRLGSIEDVVLSLSARGMTHGDIAAHLADVYGSEVSKTTISTITDKVLEGMAEWQNRPLDPVSPVVFIDCIHVEVRDGQVANRPV